MATEYVVEIAGWDQVMDLMPNPGGIPEEHTFQGELIFVRHLEIEGRVHSPARHREKRFRVWLSTSWLTGTLRETLRDLGSLEERVSDDGARELLVNLRAPESALEPAAVCLGSCWKYLRVTTDGRTRSRPRVVAFSFSRSRPDVT